MSGGQVSSLSRQVVWPPSICVSHVVGHTSLEHQSLPHAEGPRGGAWGRVGSRGTSGPLGCPALACSVPGAPSISDSPGSACMPPRHICRWPPGLPGLSVSSLVLPRLSWEAVCGACLKLSDASRAPPPPQLQDQLEDTCVALCRPKRDRSSSCICQCPVGHS